MEASVRYIVHNTGPTARSEDDGGFKPALCFRARDFAHCVVNEDSGIHVVKVPVREFDHSPPVTFKGDAYPIARAAQKMLDYTVRSVARREITQKAQRLLEGVIDGSITPEALEASETDLTPDDTAPKAPRAASGPATTIVATICSELKLDPALARRFLRKAGLSAPYTDEKLVRSTILQSLKKGE